MDIVRHEFAWRAGTEWARVMATTAGSSRPLAPGSEEEFITEHYWGYTRQRDGGTVEYQVTHPRWATWTVDTAAVHGDLAELYGAELGAVLHRPPDSAFLAVGSPITVHMPTRLPR